MAGLYTLVIPYFLFKVNTERGFRETQNTEYLCTTCRLIGNRTPTHVERPVPWVYLLKKKLTGANN